MRYAKFGTLCVIVFVLGRCDAEEPRTCKVPNGNAGTCRVLGECKPLREIYKKINKTKTETLFIRQSVGSCSHHGIKIKICCPPEHLWQDLEINPVIYPDISATSPINENDVAIRFHYEPDIFDNTTDHMQRNEIQKNARADKESHDTDNGKKGRINVNCGRNGWNNNRIVGGNPTNVDDYTWLALLEYAPNVLACGGSLITDRFVLTAAHCFYSENGPPTNVRLSEYNISSGPDDIIEVDGDWMKITVKRVSVQWWRQHPDHVENTHVNDIGLIKLTENVELSDYIQTICMPVKNYLPEFIEGMTFTVAGWGSDSVTPMSEVKRDIKLPYVSLDKCMDTYNMSKGGWMCAGGEKGKGICSGDSGGPLMYEENGEYVAVGVVSRGSGVCGAKGQPAVFTYVYDYLHWIELTMNKGD